MRKRRRIHPLVPGYVVHRHLALLLPSDLRALVPHDRRRVLAPRYARPRSIPPTVRSAFDQESLRLVRVLVVREVRHGVERTLLDLTGFGGATPSISQPSWTHTTS